MTIKLTGQHLFLIANILDELEFVDIIKEFFANSKDIETVYEDGQEMIEVKSDEEEGLDLVVVVLDRLLPNLGSVKGDLNALLASATGTTLDEIRELPMLEYIDLIKQLVTHEDFKHFFAQFLDISLENAD